MTYKQALALYKLASLKCAINYVIKCAAEQKEPEVIELTPEQWEQIKALRQQAATQAQKTKPEPKPKPKSSGGWVYPAAMVAALGLLSFPVWSSVIRGGAKGVRYGMQSGSSSNSHLSSEMQAQIQQRQERNRQEFDRIMAESKKRQEEYNKIKPMTKEELSLHWMKNSH